MQQILSDDSHFYISVVAELQPPNDGVCNARHVLCSDGREYIVKGPALSPAVPFVSVNELVAALIGKLLGFPVLEHRIIDWDGELYFGSEWLEKGAFDFMTSTLLAKCSNRRQVHELIVFDSYLINADRHTGNLIARRMDPGRRGSEIRLFFNDHSHALVCPPGRPFQLELHVGDSVGSYVRIGFVANAVTDASRLSHIVAEVESLEDQALKAVCDSIPSVWINTQDQQFIANFLICRRDHLREAFRKSHYTLPEVPRGLP